MNLPEDFKKMMENQYGADEAAMLFQSITDSDPAVSIRLNPSKWVDGDEEFAFEGLMARGETLPVPWCPKGYYLQRRPQFTLDPLLHAGAYYVQEASSMFLWYVLEQLNIHNPVTALDLCAAPGGKSTILSSILPSGSQIVVNEPIRQRAMILRENMIKWGRDGVMVTSNFADDFQPLGPVFDLILCDAPCSGEGMFRKDSNAIAEWSMSNVMLCQQRQREIISGIWPTLADGGIFIYSTCTYNHFEDEDNAQWIEDEFGAERIMLPIPEEWGIVNGHFLPHRTKGEGFYISVFRKSEGGRVHSFNKKKSEKHLHVLYCGLEPGRVVDKRKGTVEPSHTLAMSADENCKAMSELERYNTAELEYEQALTYLRSEPIVLSPNIPRGYVLVKYKSHPLGFVKNIGNRANNLYPAEWRIRSL